MSKRKTMQTRRDEFFRALESLRMASEQSSYLRGCRAANPKKYDTAETRAREDAEFAKGMAAQIDAISIFNAAIRAARKGRWS